VVACQVDNELGYHFQAHTYALDYHPDAIADFRLFVGDELAAPPRDGTDGTEERRLQWVAWKEHHLRDTLGRLARWARERGMDGVPIVHNDYPRLTTPHDLGALEASGEVDWAAADVYTTRQGGRFLRDVVRHLCGSSRVPFLAELGAGWLTLPWLLPLEATAYDEEVITLRALLGGVQAANVYMLVERDRWYGSPLSRRGERREPKASLYPRVRVLLDDLRLEELERVAPVLLVENRAEARRMATRQTLGGIVPCFQQVMPLDLRLTELPHPDTDAVRLWERGLAEVVDASGVDCDRASSAALPDLSRYAVVLMPYLDAGDEEALRQLRAAAAAGVTVAVGPGAAAGLLQLGAPGDAAGLLPAPVVGRDDERVDLTVWRGDERLVVVAANSSDDRVTTTLHFGGPVKLDGRWTAETLESAGDGDGEGEGVVVTLAPWAVQVWEVAR
jgi:beta-galactosidase